jgi:hypothetical protein
MRTNRLVVGGPSSPRFGRQTEGRVHTARGKGSLGLLIATVALTLLAVTPALAAGVTVSVSPNPAQVTPGSTVQLGAAVSGTGDTLVVWSLSGAGCSGISCGTINSQGLYTAPAAAPNPPTVTATATSLADFTTTGNSTITIIPPPPVAITLTPGAVSVKPGAQQQQHGSNLERGRRWVHRLLLRSAGSQRPVYGSSTNPQSSNRNHHGDL